MQGDVTLTFFLSENEMVGKIVDWVEVDSIPFENWPDFTDKQV